MSEGNLGLSLFEIHGMVRLMDFHVDIKFFPWFSFSFQPLFYIIRARLVMNESKI